jgi:hypothetical protein
MLPNFIIVGAAKCGTTSLDRYLKQHPDIYMCPVKEPYFFSFMNEKPNFLGPHDTAVNNVIVSDIRVYKSFFKDVQNQKAIGECSNSYLFFENTPPRIKKFIPDCRIIIILRDPIERTYSHYRQAVMIGHEELSFEEALEKEHERKENGWRWHYQYIAQSMYYQQVKRYFDLFDRKQVFVGLFEDLKADPANFTKEILVFLGVDPIVEHINFEKHNVSGIPKSKWLHNFLHGPNWLKTITKPFTPKKLRTQIYQVLYKQSYDFNSVPAMNQETREKLKKVFREDVEKLSQLIDKKLDKWHDYQK